MHQDKARAFDLVRNRPEIVFNRPCFGPGSLIGFFKKSMGIRYGEIVMLCACTRTRVNVPLKYGEI